MPSQSHSPEPKPERLIFRLLPWSILACGLALTGLQAAHMSRQARAAEQAEFALRADEIVASLQRRMDSNAQVLRGAAGLFAASVEVERGEFSLYVKRLRLPEYYPGIQALGYAQIVPARDKARHVAALRAQGFPDYDIQPPGERDIYSAVVFVEPFDWRNRRALGFDFMPEPARMSAAAQARDEARATLTGKVTLKQETEQDVQAGVLAFVAVYRGGQVPDSVEQRRAALGGWVYAALRMDDLLDNYLRSEYVDLSRQIAVSLYDRESLDADALLAEWRPAAASPDRHAEVRHFPVLNTLWSARIESLPAYWANRQTDSSSRTVLIAGLALTLAFALAARVLSASHLRVAAALQNSERAHRSLVEQEALLRAVYDSSGVAIFLVDFEGAIIHANQQMAEMFRCPLDDLAGKTYYSLVPQDERELARRRLSQLLTGKLPFSTFERRYRRQDGSEFWGQMTGRAFHDPEGQLIGIVGVIADTTERRRMEDALRTSETRYRLLAENASDMIWTMDAKGRFSYVSPAVEKLRGYTAEQALRQSVDEWLDPASLDAGQRAFGLMLEAIHTGPAASLCVELELTRAKAASVWTETTLSGLYDAQGVATGLLGVTRDITERKQARDRLAHLAHYDALTRLCNRVLFFDRLKSALALARRDKTKLALMYIDLDHFKPVNDTYGHEVGDQLLQTVAARMRSCVRASDTLGRVGGDEFVVLLPALAGVEDALGVGEKICRALRQPFAVAGQVLRISSSVGIALYPEHGVAEIELSRNADIAMYRAKECGRDNVQVFQNIMRDA